MSALRFCLVKKEGDPGLLVTSSDKLQIVLVNCIFELGTEHRTILVVLGICLASFQTSEMLIVLQPMSLTVSRKENNI